jgi:hypothetical protein
MGYQRFSMGICDNPFKPKNMKIVIANYYMSEHLPENRTGSESFMKGLLILKKHHKFFHSKGINPTQYGGVHTEYNKYPLNRTDKVLIEFVENISKNKKYKGHDTFTIVDIPKDKKFTLIEGGKGEEIMFQDDVEWISL